MKSNCLGSLSLAVLSFILTTGSHAQAMEEANVPFSFQVGATQLPAGHYLIKEDHLRKSIRIRNLDTGAMATVSVHQSSAIAAKQALVFHHIGDQHFLAEVCGDGDSLDLTLSPSKMERQARSLLIATVPPSEPVLVALR
jgi:hypothetical protein